MQELEPLHSVFNFHLVSLDIIIDPADFTRSNALFETEEGIACTDIPVQRIAHSTRVDESNSVSLEICRNMGVGMQHDVHLFIR
jgi:hypothetical protein